VITPRISIVIPCYNYGRFLPRALESVAAQEDPDWEVVVVDDGSIDETASIARQWQQRMPDHIRCAAQANTGPGAARNRGAREATGEWLLFLDADDVLLPGALVRYRDAAAGAPAAALIAAGAQTVRDGVVADVRRAGSPSRDRVDNFLAFVRGELCPFNGGAVLVHRRVTEQLAYPEHIHTSEDFVFFAHAFSRFDCAAAPGAAVAMHRHADSLRYDPGALDSARETMIDLLFDPTVLPARAMAYRNEVEAAWCLVISRASYRSGRYSDSVHYYRRAVRLRPRNLLRTGHLGKVLASALYAAVRH